jgi:UDP:flavonoid glycosyltransferase YjiC (YdhE family)
MELTAGDLTLVIGTPETDPLPSTARATYIGPILWQSPHAVLPEWIETWAADRPLVWAYSGNPRYLPVDSAADSGVVLDATIEALATEPVRVVLTTGHQPLPKRFRVLPSNIRHCPYVPGLAMAERSDLLIHHGGYGSCQTGLYTGTPAVIVPTYSERESNARRVAALGAGEFVVPDSDRSGRKKTLAAEALRTTVRQVLGDPRYRAKARAISARMRTYRGAEFAAEQIEAFAGLSATHKAPAVAVQT